MPTLPIFSDTLIVLFGLTLIECMLCVFEIYKGYRRLGKLTSYSTASKRAATFLCSLLGSSLTKKVRNTAKIRNRYNKVPHLTQETTWESKKIKHHHQEVSPFPAGGHKTAINRHESIRNTRQTQKH